MRGEPVGREAVRRFVTFLRVRLIFFPRGLVPHTGLFAGRFSVRIALHDYGIPGVRVLYEPLAFGGKACGSDRG